VVLARPVRLAVLLTLAGGALLWAASTASAARSRAHRPAHHALRCRRSARTHVHAGSIRQTHRPAHARRRCRRHHRARRHHALARHHRFAGGRSRLAGPDGICPDAELRPSEADLDRIRAATLCLVNRARASHGEAALRPNAHLRQAAQGHTESMISADYFEHIGPGGQTLLARLRDAGYIYSSQIGYAIGENIAWGTGRLGTPRAIVAAWMGSPEHRANILDPRYRDTAIGISARLPASVAHGQTGGIYTQDFGVVITA
jgi:uncharacterized protein YkwD